MIDYLKTTVGKTISDALISLAGYVGGYSLVNPNDKHGVKSSKLLCKGKVICVPFYHSGHCCQVYLNYDRTNFEEVAYGVLFPDGKIIDISTGCPGVGEPTVKPELFGPNCQLIYSKTMHSFPEHIDMLNTDDYFYYGTDDISENSEDTVINDEVDENVVEHIREHTFTEQIAHDLVEELTHNEEIINKIVDEISDRIVERVSEQPVDQQCGENTNKLNWKPSIMPMHEHNFCADPLPEEDGYWQRSRDVLHEEDENSPAIFDNKPMVYQFDPNAHYL